MKDEDVLREFEEVMTRNQIFIYSLAYRLTGNQDDALDLSQETFVQAWEHFGQLRNRRNPLPWLRKICVNLLLAAHRKKAGIEEISLQERDAGDLGEVVDISPTPEEEAIVGEAVRDIQDNCFTAMASRLPLEQRACFSMVDMFGVSIEEVASILGRSLSATRALLHRGRANMNAFFGHRCQWVLPQNACKCEAWRNFVDNQEAIQGELRRRKVEQVDFSAPDFARTSDPATLPRVLVLFRNLPQHYPDAAWFNKVIEAIRK